MISGRKRRPCAAAAAAEKEFIYPQMTRRRKELLHFARFHIFSALLLSQVIGAAGMVCGWMPGVVFKGRMAYLWAAFAFIEMLTVLHCMQCSHRGMLLRCPFHPRFDIHQPQLVVN